MSSLQPLWQGFQYQNHQITGVRWLIEREALTPSGGILCDEMGLGKTIQMLGLVKETKANATLLIGPLCVLDQWQETAERCGFCVWRCHSSKDEWELPKNFRPGAKHLYVVNYERAIARPNLVNQRVWPRVVFDEAHRMADPKGTCHVFAKEEISAKSRWFLTATPVVNGLRDALSLSSSFWVTRILVLLKWVTLRMSSKLMCSVVVWMTSVESFRVFLKLQKK